MDYEQTFKLAVQMHRAGQLAEAEELYRQVIAEKPDHAEANNNLGNLLSGDKKCAEAIPYYDQVLAMYPNGVGTMINLGNALMAVGELNEAISVYRRAIKIQADHAGALTGLGKALKEVHQVDEAIACLRRSVAVRPESANANYHLGLALEQAGKSGEALAAYQAAVRLDAKIVVAHCRIAEILQAQGTTDAALAACRTAIEMQPEQEQAHQVLGHTYAAMGRIDLARKSFCQAFDLVPTDPALLSEELHAMYFDPACDAAAIGAAHQDWNQRFGQLLLGVDRRPEIDRSPDRRLRVAYISPHFRSHPATAFVLPLLEHHDKQQVEIWCFHNSVQCDAVTDRLRKCADQWVPIMGMTDDELVYRIRSDRIDVLVDLAAHLPGGRLTALAHKPAPVQVAYPPYPGTTGVPAVDYRLTDSFVDPPDGKDFYSETNVRLPHTFACYDPAGLEQTPIGDAAQSLTFACFNNPAKLNDRTYSLWSGVLKAVSGSRMRILAPDGKAREFISGRLRHFGVNSDRVDFVGKQARSSYLSEYERVDVCLDTLPYNGHASTLDAIGMGVPVVTRVGDTAAGRIGWSLLNNLQLTDLAARDDDEFGRIAAQLIIDRPRLADMRRTLRNRLFASPLMDAKGFARDVEAAYRSMWLQCIAT
jgi:protein O-GlcNAc transferase